MYQTYTFSKGFCYPDSHKLGGTYIFLDRVHLFCLLSWTILHDEGQQTSFNELLRRDFSVSTHTWIPARKALRRSLPRALASARSRSPWDTQPRSGNEPQAHQRASPWARCWAKASALGSSDGWVRATEPGQAALLCNTQQIIPL